MLEKGDNKVMEKNFEVLMNGRYGEKIFYSKDGEGGYMVSCRDIGMEKCHMSKQEFADFERRYVKEGVSDFDKSDLQMIKSRAKQMGRWVQRCYNYLEYQLKEEVLVNSAWIYQTMLDAEVLNLTEEQYIKWFILQDFKTEPDQLSEERKEYLRTLLSLKKRAIDPYNQ